MASIFTTQRDTIHIIIFLLIKPKNSTTMIFVMRKILKGNNNKRQWKRHNIVNAEAIVRQNIIDKWLNTASSPEKIEIQLNKITAWFWLFSIVFPLRLFLFWCCCCGSRVIRRQFFYSILLPSTIEEKRGEQKYEKFIINFFSFDLNDFHEIVTTAPFS